MNYTKTTKKEKRHQIISKTHWISNQDLNSKRTTPHH